MKAFLLTAGLGTRLHPLTDHTPKCLLPIAGRPLIDYWLDLFRRYGIDEVLINLHHLPEKVRDYLATVRFPGKIHTFYEPELLGSAGTLSVNRQFVVSEPWFFVFYGDNLTNIKIDRWLQFHQAKGGDATLMLYRTDAPHRKGIVELDADGKVLSFEEKPAHPKSNLASAGLYLASPAIFDVFPENKSSLDMAFDILPKLIGRMWGMISDDIILDIGTPEDYRLAQQKALQIHLETS
jgi:mannose-1-phosphate guanylyltransferase